MKMRIYNPDSSEVNIKIFGVRVVIPPRRADLVDVNIARALQEIQPQLEYHKIDDDLIRKEEKNVKTELIARAEKAEAEIEEIKEEARVKLKEANAKVKELEKQLKKTKTKKSNKPNKSKSNDKKKK